MKYQSGYLQLACLVFISFLKDSRADIPVEVTPRTSILSEGQELRMICRVGIALHYCRFNIPSLGGLNINPDVSPDSSSGAQYFGEGLEKGVCGLKIPRVADRYNGVFTCTMGFRKQSTESSGNMTLIVAKAPNTPILAVSNGTYSEDTYKEDETLYASCKVKNGRPVANISWFIGSELIQSGLSLPSTSYEPNDLYTIVQNLTRRLTHKDHGRDLRCVAGHMAFTQRSINQAIYRLNIRFKPKPPSEAKEVFGFEIGKPGNVLISVYANPKPTFTWEVDRERLEEGQTDSTGRFKAFIPQNKGHGQWELALHITRVTAADVERKYILYAKNDLGQEQYKIAISTSPQPPMELSAGAIVGIVVAILLILLIICILIFARATGRWCFAAGNSRHKSSSEAAIEDVNEEKKQPSIHGKDGVYSSAEYINGNEKIKSDKVDTPV